MSQPLDPLHAEFLRLYAEHEAALHVFVRSMLSCREEADEVMQQVLVVLWTKFETARDFKYKLLHRIRLALLECVQRKLAEEKTA